MNSIKMLFICLLLTSCATDPWTKNQVGLQATATALQVIDWGLTLDIADKPEDYYEINPALGRHPSRGRVNCYFICSVGLKILITHILPSEWRGYWLGSNILVSGYLVHHGYKVGLRVNF